VNVSGLSLRLDVSARARAVGHMRGLVADVEDALRSG
jgi:hypothetical protein